MMRGYERPEDPSNDVVKSVSGMTKEEQELMTLVMQANNLFISLERMHPNEAADWVAGIHQLQYVMGMRTLRRDYPKHYATIKS